MKVLKKDEIVRRRQVLPLLICSLQQVTRIKIERLILERANHPFIVKLYYAFQTNERLYLITDFMQAFSLCLFLSSILQGGDFFTHLSRFGIMREVDARLYICEIILAVHHLHEMGIIYVFFSLITYFIERFEARKHIIKQRFIRY